MDSVHSSSDSITLKASNIDKSVPRRVSLSPIKESKTAMTRNLEHEQQAQDALLQFLAGFQHGLTENHISALAQDVVSGNLRWEFFGGYMQNALINAVDAPDLHQLHELFDGMRQAGNNLIDTTISSNTTTSPVSSLTSGGSHGALAGATGRHVIENDMSQRQVQAPVVDDDSDNQHQGDPEHHRQELVQDDEATTDSVALEGEQISEPSLGYSSSAQSPPRENPPH